MRPTFLGFETTRKSLMASQKALDITGHNISNVNTKGYTRQRLDLFSIVTPNSGHNAASRTTLSGQGVMAAGVSQVRDPYLDKRFRELNSVTAEAGVRTGVLTDIENVLDNITTDGISKAMENFSNVMNQFATDAADKPELGAVARQAAAQVVSVLNNYSDRLISVESQTKYEIDGQINEVNATLKKLAELNGQIKQAYINTGDLSSNAVAQTTVNATYGPNELLDARNVLLDSLSTYGELDVVSQNDGTVTVKMGGNEVLKDTSPASLSYKTDAGTGALVVSWDNGGDFKPDTGSLKAYIDLYNGNGCYAKDPQNGENGVAYFKTTIDNFAKSLHDEFNKMSNSTTGYNMFKTADGSDATAANIRISDEWLKDPLVLTPVNQDGKLDNQHILKIISVFSKDVEFGDMQEFKGNFNSFISYYQNKLSQEIKFQDGRYKSTLDLTNSIMKSRDSVSSVSMDEEGINMMNFQKWFNASARMMTTLDEALDKIINGMGLVGR